MHCHTIVHASTGMQLQLCEQSSALIDQLKHATAGNFCHMNVPTRASYLERKSECL